LKVEEAEARRVEALVGYARIVAPFDGIVTQRNVHTGHLLQPPGDAARATPLFVVVRTDKVRVFVDVPEAQAGFVCAGKAGCPVSIRCRG
jgi:multidrug resistance efflux pump